MTSTNALFVAEIERWRHQAICDATRSALDSGFPADVVEDIALRAGQQWDIEHPLVASGHVGGLL